MRLRVLGILGSLLCLIAVLLGAVLLQGVSRDATADVQQNRFASLNRFVQLATHADSQAEQQMLQLEMDTYSELYNEGLLVRIGPQELVSGGIDPLDPQVAATVRNAGLNLGLAELPMVNPFDTEPVLLSQPFANSSQVLGSVTMRVNLDAARSHVLRSSSALLLLTLSICAALLLFADRLSAWVLRPVLRLNDAVDDLAHHQTPVPLEAKGPPEIRALSQSFSSMAQTVASSLKQQQELIAETSHQLRNPVAALRLRVDLLKMRLGDQVDPAGVQSVEKELDRVETLLDGVMRLASAEHRLTERRAADGISDVSTKRERINAVQMVTEEIERQSEVAGQLGNTLSLDLRKLESDEVFLCCNAFDLQQMLSELMENAFKYAPGTQIDLSVQSSAGVVDILVEDHGSGMSEEDLLHVGERFWRAESVRQSPGTGLGIAIVDRLARANSGQLILESGVGRGLKATLRLPVDKKSVGAAS